MILVRIVFQAKMGHSSEVVAAMKGMTPGMKAAAKGAHRVRLLTDISGRFDTVVQEMEYDSVDAFLADLKAMSSMPDMEGSGSDQAAFSMLEGGYKEYYTIEDEQ